MLKRILASAALVAICAVPLSAQQQKPAAADEMTLTGTVIDVSCAATKGAAALGAGHKMCADACAKAGAPLAILASDGNIYLPVSANPGDPQNPRLLQFTHSKVKVTGVHRLTSGMHTIEIKTIEAAT